MSPVRPPVLTQQITTDFQLSQEAWNKLNSQITDMEETNKLLKRAVKNAYKKCYRIPNPPPKKASSTTKTPKKVDKIVKFVDKSNKVAKTSTRL